MVPSFIYTQYKKISKVEFQSDNDTAVSLEICADFPPTVLSTEKWKSHFPLKIPESWGDIDIILKMFKAVLTEP